MSAINYNGAKQAAFQYNKAGELVRMEDWTGVNTFELDLLGQLKKATDHKGSVTEYTYDEVGNQTSVKYPDGGVVQNTYDPEGNLLKVMDTDPFPRGEEDRQEVRVSKIIGMLVEAGGSITSK